MSRMPETEKRTPEEDPTGNRTIQETGLQTREELSRSLRCRIHRSRGKQPVKNSLFLLTKSEVIFNL